MLKEEIIAKLTGLTAIIVILTTAGGGCRSGGCSKSPKSVSPSSQVVYRVTDQGVVVPVQPNKKEKQ
jgi:hypothetical protein